MHRDLPNRVPPARPPDAGGADDSVGRLLILGLAVVLLSLAAFGLITEQVLRGDTYLVQLDRRFDGDLPQDKQDAPLLGFFERVTEWGGEDTMIVLGVGVSLGLLATGRWRLTLAVLLTALVGVKLNLVFKSIFQVSRPPLAKTFNAHVGPYGFPSGHAMGSLIVYGLLAYLLTLELRRRRWSRTLVTAALAVLVLLIGFSRIYLHAHYFSQVVGGFAAGAAWLALCLTAIEAARRRGAVG
jgi:undecaprenyl-diphosphatase